MHNFLQFSTIPNHRHAKARRRRVVRAGRLKLELTRIGNGWVRLGNHILGSPRLSPCFNGPTSSGKLAKCEMSLVGSLHSGGDLLFLFFNDIVFCGVNCDFIKWVGTGFGFSPNGPHIVFFGCFLNGVFDYLMSCIFKSYTIFVWRWS